MPVACRRSRRMQVGLPGYVSAYDQFLVVVSAGPFVATLGIMSLCRMCLFRTASNELLATPVAVDDGLQCTFAHQPIIH